MRFELPFLFVLLHASSPQHLVVQTSGSYLQSCFEGISESVVGTLLHKFFQGTFRQELRTGSLDAHSIYITDLRIRQSRIEHRDDAYFIKLIGFDMQLSGLWKYDAMLILRDSGNFTLTFGDMNATLGPIVPEVFDGIPFIAADVNCSLQFRNFGFQVAKPGALTNLLSGLMLYMIQWKIEKTICSLVTSATDLFLRNGVQRLLLRHSLSTGDILSNLVVLSPLLSSDGGLVTHHAGALQGENVTLVETRIPSEPRTSHVTYFVFPQMVDQVLLSVHRKTLFDGVFDDNVEYSLNVTAVKPPTVSFANGRIVMNMEQRFVLRKGGLLSSNNTFSFNTTLSVLYSLSVQLVFFVLEDPELPFLSERMHEKFAFKLLRHLRFVVSSHLRVPLPSAYGVLIDRARIQLNDDFIVFETTFRRSATTYSR